MTETEILTAIKTIIVVHETHVNDEEGDKYLSDPNLAMEAISSVAFDRIIDKGVLLGFITE